MQQGFLEREAKEAGKKTRTLFSILTFIFIVLSAGVGFAVKGSMDLNDVKTQKILIIFLILCILMLLSTALVLFMSCRAASDSSKSLILPFKENTREAVRDIINKEVAEGKVLVDEYAYTFPEGKKPYGGRLMLLPSYLLRFNDMGQITVIPRDKIYCICPQVGLKGRSPFIVRLIIFTEKAAYYLDGTDVEHFNGIAGQLYQYIPKVFNDFDPVFLPYELDRLYSANRREFIELYEAEKKKQTVS